MMWECQLQVQSNNVDHKDNQLANPVSDKTAVDNTDPQDASFIHSVVCTASNTGAKLQASATTCIM